MTTPMPNLLTSTTKPGLLFLCVANSARSQMAEGFARMLGEGKIEAHSSGSRPSGKVNPRAIQFMAEMGYNLGTHTSKGLDTFNGTPVEVAVTMGCGDSCPMVNAKRREEWQIPDPKELPDEGFRQIRDLIRDKVKALLDSI